MGKRRSARIRRKERKLFERYKNQNDLKAREALVKLNTPLAESIARRFLKSGELLEDLVQVSCIGLLKAVDRFDLSRGNNFSAYAVPKMISEIRHYLRDDVWSVHVSRGVKELCKDIEKTRLELTRQNKCFPSVAEIAEALGISPEMVHRADIAWKSKSLSSLKSFLADDGNSDLSPTFEPYASGYENVELWGLLRPALTFLSDNECEIIYLRFFEDLSQDEIADKMGFSQMHISRLLRKSLELLREKLEDNGLDCVEKVG